MDGVTYAPGHLVPVADRNRPDNKNKEAKNNLAISLLSNIVPQQNKHNQGFWATIENYTRQFVNNSSKNYEVYVVTGTHGIKKRSDGSDAEIDGSEPIKIPEYLWRVLLVVDRLGADVQPNTYTVGFWTENRQPTEDEKNWNDKDNWKTSTIIKSVNEIENLTGYNFFSNIPSNIQENIESNREIFWDGEIPDNFIPNPGPSPKPSLSSTLMGEQIAEVESSGIFSSSGIKWPVLSTETAKNTTVGHNGVLANSIIEVRQIDLDSTNEIGLSQIRPTKHARVENSSDKTSTTEVGILKVDGVEIDPIEIGITEVSPFQINRIKLSPTEVSSTKIGISEVSIIQISPFQVGVSEISSSEFSTDQIGFSKTGISKVSPLNLSHLEISPFKINSTEISTFEVNVPQISPTQISPTQVNSSQISIVQHHASEFGVFLQCYPQLRSLRQIRPSHHRSPRNCPPLRFHRRLRTL
ncbi:MAG: DNA/RNA non-specific endonuclease [Cyanobacteria bacterium P01_G01_bin.49]